MSKLFTSLPSDAQRGSKPRCHLLTHGSREQVAERLTSLIAPWGTVSPDDRWMPEGFAHCEEAQLHKATQLLKAETCEALGRWWLPHDRLGLRTPNWDIVSTCTIKDLQGLLLVEAKAYDKEFLNEAPGRRLETKEEGEQAARDASHRTIGLAIEQARQGLSAATGLSWQISRDSYYQLSNRFAWSWKLAELGFPLIMVYLGFLNADEMRDKGAPFADPTAWESLVTSHGGSVVPVSAWNAEWHVNGVPFVPIIQAIDQPLIGESGV